MTPSLYNFAVLIQNKGERFLTARSLHIIITLTETIFPRFPRVPAYTRARIMRTPARALCLSQLCNFTSSAFNKTSFNSECAAFSYLFFFDFIAVGPKHDSQQVSYRAFPSPTAVRNTHIEYLRPDLHLIAPFQ
jgi:hypothetical protein